MTILVVGIGSIGKRHLRNLLFLGYKDVICVDPDKKKLKDIKEEFNVRIHTQLHKVLRSERPNVTLICSPTSLHVAHADLALHQGSHVFIEKPISHNLDGISALIKGADKKHRVVMVACNYRFHKGWLMLQKALASLRYGKALLGNVINGYYLPSARSGINYKNIYAAKKNEGGVFLDSGIHIVDYLRELFGDIKKVAFLKSSMHSLDISSDEIAHVILEHSSGITSSLSLDYVRKQPTHKLEVVTDRGTFMLDFKEDYLTFSDDKIKKILYKGSGDTNKMFVDELVHFFKCIDDNKKPAQDLRAAKSNLEVLLSFHESK